MGERVVSRLQTRVVGMERAAVFVVVAARRLRHQAGRCRIPAIPRASHLPALSTGRPPRSPSGRASWRTIARLAVAQARFDGAEF